MWGVNLGLSPCNELAELGRGCPQELMCRFLVHPRGRVPQPFQDGRTQQPGAKLLSLHGSLVPVRVKGQMKPFALL